MSTFTFSSVNLSNDLSGTLSNPYVVSVSNVKFGALPVTNGGLGGYSIPFGSLIIGNNAFNPFYLTGSDGDILKWSDPSGSWIAQKTENLKNVSFELENNELFTLNSSSVNETKAFYINFPIQLEKKFLASSVSSSSQPFFRDILSDDLPHSIYGKTLYDVNVSGTFSGSFSSETKILGDGSLIYNLSSSQVNNFKEDIENILLTNDLKFNSVIANTASLLNTFASGSFNGDFFGNGAGLNSISTINIDDFSNRVRECFTSGQGINIVSGTISQSGSAFPVASINTNILPFFDGDSTLNINLNDNIILNSVTSSIIEAQNINSNNIKADNITSLNFSGSFTGNLSGPGTGIYNIPNNSLVNDYIIINNNPIKLGESAQISGISEISSSDKNIISSIVGDKAVLSLNPELSGTQINCLELSASYLYGDGSNLTNVSIQNILPVVSGVLDFIKVDNNNVIYNNNDEISLSNIISLDESYTNRSIINTLTSSIITSEVVSASVLYGNGYNITTLNAANIINLDSAINATFTGSQNINTITTYGETKIELKDNIYLNSVTSSFSGDGSKISNILSPAYKIFTSSLSFSVGNVVCLTTNGLEKADNRYKEKNKPIGIVSSTSGNIITVQTNLEAFLGTVTFQHLNGSTLYLGINGSTARYLDIGSNCFAVELGYVTQTNNIFINFKKLWKVS